MGKPILAAGPRKRKNSGKLELKDLRAIPFVGAFSQLKQNVTGYYGVGTALQEMEKKGKWKQVKNLYNNSPYFKTLLDNSEMAMKKCFFPLTETFSKHPKFGKIWMLIFNEFELTKKYIFKLSGKQELMSGLPHRTTVHPNEGKNCASAEYHTAICHSKIPGSRKVGLRNEENLRKTDHTLFIWNY